MVLKVEHLSKQYPRKESGRFGKTASFIRAVQDVSFELPAGRSLAVLGEAGAGKTALGRCLARLERPDRGRILLEGRDLALLEGRALQAMRSRVQYLYPNPRAALNPMQTVGQLLAEPLQILPRGETVQLQDRVSELSVALGVNAFLHGKRPSALSTAMVHRVAAVRVLTLRPAVLIWDGASEAMEAAAFRVLLETLRALQRREGFAFIWTTRRPEFAREAADEVLELYPDRAEERPRIGVRTQE